MTVTLQNVGTLVSSQAITDLSMDIVSGPTPQDSSLVYSLNVTLPDLQMNVESTRLALEEMVLKKENIVLDFSWTPHYSLSCAVGDVSLNPDKTLTQTMNVAPKEAISSVSLSGLKLSSIQETSVNMESTLTVTLKPSVLGDEVLQLDSLDTAFEVWAPTSSGLQHVADLDVTLPATAGTSDHVFVLTINHAVSVSDDTAVAFTAFFDWLSTGTTASTLELKGTASASFETSDVKVTVPTISIDASTAITPNGHN